MSRPFVQVPSVADGDPFTEHMWDTYIRETSSSRPTTLGAPAASGRVSSGSS